MNTNRPNFLSNLPPVVLNLIIINTIAWIATAFVMPRLGIDLTQILGLHFYVDDSFNPLQLLSYMFMHDTASFTHLFFNMFGIFMFGSDIERIWGWKKFLFFYILCGIGAGICQQFAWMIDFDAYLTAFETAISGGSTEAFATITGNKLNGISIPEIIELKGQYFNVITVGASGSLFGLLLAFGWLFPERKIMLLFFPVPIPARIFVGIYAAIELFLGVQNFSGDNVAHFAHLGGMIFGALPLIYWKLRGKLYY